MSGGEVAFYLQGPPFFPEVTLVMRAKKEVLDVEHGLETGLTFREIYSAEFDIVGHSLDGLIIQLTENLPGRKG